MNSNQNLVYVHLHFLIGSSRGCRIIRQVVQLRLLVVFGEERGHNDVRQDTQQVVFEDVGDVLLIDGQIGQQPGGLDDYFLILLYLQNVNQYVSKFFLID